MADWTDQPKNPSAFANESLGLADETWDEATQTWNDAQGTWDAPKDVFSNEQKNASSFINQTKN